MNHVEKLLQAEIKKLSNEVEDQLWKLSHLIKEAQEIDGKIQAMYTKINFMEHHLNFMKAFEEKSTAHGGSHDQTNRA